MLNERMGCVVFVEFLRVEVFESGEFLRVVSSLSSLGSFSSLLTSSSMLGSYSSLSMLGSLSSF